MKHRQTKTVKQTWYGGKRVVEVAPPSPPAYGTEDEKTAADVESGEWLEDVDTGASFPRERRNYRRNSANTTPQPRTNAPSSSSRRCTTASQLASRSFSSGTASGRCSWSGGALSLSSSFSPFRNDRTREKLTNSPLSAPLAFTRFTDSTPTQSASPSSRAPRSCTA